MRQARVTDVGCSARRYNKEGQWPGWYDNKDQKCYSEFESEKSLGIKETESNATGYPPAWSTEANLTASAYYENTSLLRLNPWKYVSQYVRMCPCVSVCPYVRVSLVCYQFIVFKSRSVFQVCYNMCSRSNIMCPCTHFIQPTPVCDSSQVRERDGERNGL